MLGPQLLRVVGQQCCVHCAWALTIHIFIMFRKKLLLKNEVVKLMHGTHCILKETGTIDDLYSIMILYRMFYAIFKKDFLEN